MDASRHRRCRLLPLPRCRRTSATCSRIDVDLDRLEFGVMKELFEVGHAYVQEIDDLKKQANEEGAVKASKRKRLAGDSLRERDPW